MKIGNKIKSKRKQLDLSQNELAEKLDVSQSQVSRWEKNISSPDSKKIKGLAKILGLTNIELLGKRKIKENDFRWLKIIKYIMIILLLLIVFLTFYIVNDINSKAIGKYTINCKLDDKEYKYEIKYNKYGRIIKKNKKLFSSFTIQTDEARYTLDYIEEYYKNKSGECIITDN